MNLLQKTKSYWILEINLQKQIDEWHIKNKGNEINIDEYKKFLLEIGYLKEEGPDFKIETNNIDEEIANIAGPQLVVPIMNARYALNAANARWMSLYDSLYGTDAIKPIDTSKKDYDASRGELVINYAKEFLDKYFSLKNFSWKEVTSFNIQEKSLIIYNNERNNKVKRSK
jgi:malate synthase